MDTGKEPNPVTADYSADRARTKEILDKREPPETLEKIFGGKKGLTSAERSAEILALRDGLKDN